MKLSVIIPVYNGADFIQKSYHSIINQHLEDFEIIYIDNNSSDDSRDHIKELLKQDSRVSLYMEAKQGAAAARNAGIKNATGDYLYIFDVDDEIYPDALKKMIAVLDAHPNVDAVFGNMVKSNTGIETTPKPQGETFKVVVKEKPYWGLKWFSDLKTVVGPPAFLYRNTVFSKIGMYNESIHNNEDTALDIKLGMSCTVAFLEMYVYLYYKHDSSTIQMAKKNMQRAFMVWPRLVKEHLPFYLEHEVPTQFKLLLFSQLFQSMGRQIEATKGISERRKLRKQLLRELRSIHVPYGIRLYLSILAVFPLQALRKVYSYYIVPKTVQRMVT